MHCVPFRWLLLDEINLAPSEVLERIAGILEDGANGSVTLVERGDSSQVSGVFPGVGGWGPGSWEGAGGREHGAGGREVMGRRMAA